MSDRKPCPFCHEDIHVQAVKCRYCNEWFDERPSGQSLATGSHPNPPSGHNSSSRSSAPSGTHPSTPSGHTPLTGIHLVNHALGDRYEVLEEIGSGGMATVYKAIQKSLGRTVALKVIHQNLVHDEEFVKRFHREAQISASLQHPNIVTIHDVGEAQGVHYMAMEYLEGTDLHRMITKSGRLGEQQSLSYVLSVARALEYVHKRGLIHRDIKSSNIFICSDADASQTGLDANTGLRHGARVVLMDFGIAHAASGTRLTRAGAVIGSPEYMSPEQAEAKPVDHRSDIYSLGVVLYECLTGRVPFKTDSYISTIRKVIDEPPDANMLNHVDKDLSQFTLGLMSKRAHDRPANAKRVVGLLGELLAGGASGKPSTGDISGLRNEEQEVVPTGPEESDTAEKDRRTVNVEYSHKETSWVPDKKEKHTHPRKTAHKQHSHFPKGNDPFEELMVLVEGGTFMMGATIEQEMDAFEDEKPAHAVTLDDFYMCKYPVTQKQWVEIMGHNPSYFNDCDHCPVETVSWEQVQEFIEKLNKRTGKRYSLPTEAQWEFAARGGNMSKGFKFSGSNNIDDVAWYNGNSNCKDFRLPENDNWLIKLFSSKKKTQPVGVKHPNELGLYDMSGNVWEMCSDWYFNYGNNSTTNPTGPSSGSNRVLRGGSWYVDENICRVSHRNIYTPYNKTNSVGFRLVLVPKTNL